MTKHPVANTALSCLLSWSMIMSGYMPVASALAEEATFDDVTYQQASGSSGTQSADDAAGGAGEQQASEPESGDVADASGTDAADASRDGVTYDDVTAADAAQPSGSQQPSADAAATDDQSDQSDQAGAQSSAAALSPEEALSLVYVAASSVAANETQQVAVLLADESAQLSFAQLTLQAPNGQVTVDAAATDGSGLLFNVDASQLGLGTVTLAALSLTYADGTAATVDLTQVENAYTFQVTEASGSVLDSDALTAYTIDDDGNLVQAGSLAEAIEASGAQEAMASALAASDDEASAQSTVCATDGKVHSGLVIALDPGHDNQSPGSTGNGLYEEDVNLKIAQACRDELETYPGVSVHMTRSDSGDCPYYTDGNHNESQCLKRRVQDAAAAGATIVVSIHNNSSESSSAHGAEVWYPSYNAGDKSITADGQKIAESVQSRLVALGLYDRGAKSDDTYTDDDGVERDYYSIIRNSKALSMPGIIIEHAFMTSYSDSQYLSSDAWLKKMGIADATGIAQALGLSKDKNNADVTLTRLTVADTDGKLGQATLRATGVNGASRFYAVVTYSDGKSDTVEFGQSDEGWWFGTYDFAKTGRVAENVTIKGYKVDSSGNTTQVGSYEGTLKRFSDLEVGAWYLGYVNDVATQGIITGYTDSDGVTRQFGPEDTLTRGQIATMLWRLAGSPSCSGSTFKDVASGQFYTTAVEWACQAGVVTGDTDASGNMTGYFRPEDNVTREELATMLYRYAQSAGFGSNNGSISSFPDAGNVSSWAKQAMAWCNNKGIITGDQGYSPARLLPQSNATRAQAAKMLSVFSDCTGGATPDTTAFNVSKLNYALTDEAQGVVFWTIAGEVKKTGSVSIKIWKKGDTSTAKTYAAQYVTQDLADENDDLEGYVGSWAVVVPISQMSSGTYEAQVYAAKSASGTKDAYAKCTVKMNLHPILNAKSTVTAAQLVKAYKASGYTYPSKVYKSKGAETIDKFCEILVKEAKAEGVDPGVVFVQAMTETGWLQFGGDVKAEQCNFAGLGATGSGVSGATFADVQTGLRAQVQHLRLYADSTLSATDSKDSKGLLKNAVVDQRFFTYLAGRSPYVEGLGTRWASSVSYGWDLAAMYDEL